MEKELKSLQMETFTKATTFKENQKDLGNITGQMEVTLKEFFKKESETGMESGKSNKGDLTNTRVNTSTIKSKVMESSPGLPATFTKEITVRINEMGTDKCIGLMEVFIKASGEKESNMEWARS